MKTSPIALWIWYRGDRFRGYQRQVEGPTVQEALQTALTTAAFEATPVASGRTDLGVHARMQVVSFRPKGGGSAVEIGERIRTGLPEGLGIAAMATAVPSFHAQWSAVSKEYRYRLTLGERDPGWDAFAWTPGAHERLAGAVIDPERLAGLLKRIEGTRDFIAFHEKSSVQKPRTVWRSELVPLRGGVFEVVLRGEGFARYQVRYLVGTAVAVAAGAIPEELFLRALETGESIAGLKAPAHGLILWEVGYPPEVDPFAAARATGGEGMPAEPPFTNVL